LIRTLLLVILPRTFAVTTHFSGFQKREKKKKTNK
jgi:hypothetical protein